MIDAGPSLDAAAGIAASSLVAYLSSTGWEQRSSGPNLGFIVFSKALSGAKQDVHVLLPRKAALNEERMRVAQVLRTLEVVEERPIEEITEDIRREDREGAKWVVIGLIQRARITADGSSYPITSIRSLGREAAERLKREGIRTTIELLRASRTPTLRVRIAAKIGIDSRRVLEWATAADRMRVKGVGAEYAELLRAAGVKTVSDLKVRNPDNLVEQMSAANKPKLVRLLPKAKTVGLWIENARKLPSLLTW